MANEYSAAQQAQKKAAKSKVNAQKTPGQAHAQAAMGTSGGPAPALGPAIGSGGGHSADAGGWSPFSGAVGKMTDWVKGAGAPKEKTSAEVMKDRAKGALGEIIAAGQSGIKGIEASQASAQQALRSAAQTAQQRSMATAGGALAAGQASAGRFGGSAYGGALQAGMGAAQQGADIAQRLGLQQAQVGMEGARALDKARRLAAEDKFQAIKAERELGTTKENQARKWADYEQRIAVAGKEAGWFGEQKEVARQMRQWAEMEDDPELKQRLLKEAHMVATDQRDV